MNNKKSNNISNSMLKIRIKESLKDYAFQPFVFLGKENSNLINFYLIYMCVCVYIYISKPLELPQFSNSPLFSFSFFRLFLF